MFLHLYRFAGGGRLIEDGRAIVGKYKPGGRALDISSTAIKWAER